MSSYVYGALDLANLMNLQFIRDLSCVQNFKFPVNYSVLSHDLIPSDISPGLASITFRRSGEIRVVHGKPEIHNAIQKALKNDEEKPEDKQSDDEQKKETWIKVIDCDIFGSNEGLKILSQIFENLIKVGWEIVTNGNFTTTPGFEIITFVLKKNVTPQSETSVTSVVINNNESGKNKVEIVGHAPNLQINNVLKGIIIVKGDGEGEKTSAKTPDDPDCPSSFELEESVNLEKVIYDLTHLLFCRQWKLIYSTEDSGRIVLTFCLDSRILPSLGQESFAMLSIQKPKNCLQMYKLSQEAEEAIKEMLEELSEDSVKKIEDTKDGMRELELDNSIWTYMQEENKHYDFSKHMVLSKMLLILNTFKWNVYSSITLNRGSESQRIMIILKQSNVAYTDSLILQPKGLNKLTIHGASDEDLKAIRKCLQSRWPYPLTRDNKMEQDWHLMKVKRYPWNVSYGNKHADKAMELAKEGLKRTEYSVPSPSNMDCESAKSVVLFLIKELGALGWRVQLTADVFSENKTLFIQDILPSRPKDADAIFMLR